MRSNDGTTPRRFGAAFAGAAIGVAGLTGSLLLVGAADATETRPSVATSEDADKATQVENEGHEDIDFEFDLEALQEEWAEFDACLVDHGVLTEEEAAAMYDDADFDEDQDEWDEDWDEDGEWDEAIPSVAVEHGDQVTFIDFGEGDGTVTIEKVGDEITVSSTGDLVQEDIDLAELEAEFEDEFGDVFIDDEYVDDLDDLGDLEDLDEETRAEIERWDEAIEDCADLAPEDGLFGDDGDLFEDEYVDELDDLDDEDSDD